MISIAGLLFVIASLLAFALVIVAIIFFSNISLELKEKKKQRIRKSLGFLISKAIFYEDEGTEGSEMLIAPRHKRLLLHSVNRQYMIDEILAAQRNLSGVAEINLRKLYNQFHLNKDSARNLDSGKWHIKAKAIQELAYMDQREYIKKIYKLINSKNVHIRMEAQLAVVQYMGFEGLRFLDVVSAPINEWQQMKLISLLEKLPCPELKSALHWLQSENDSVVSFTLKLIGMYQLADLHDEVIKCLRHPDNHIRIRAIQCLVEISKESTANLLIRNYETGDPQYQLCTLNALSIIDAHDHSAFFYRQLLHPDNDVKLAAARGLAKTSAAGIISLDSFGQSQIYPWKNIIAQVKQEIAA